MITVIIAGEIDVTTSAFVLSMMLLKGPGPTAAGMLAPLQVAVTTESVIDFVTRIFVLSTMLSIGLQLTVAQVLEPLRRRRLMTKSLLVNIVLVPALAIVVLNLIPMEPGYATGIFLIAIAPGASFGPKLAEFQVGDISFAISLMATLVIVSVVTIPATVALFYPGGASADPLAIAQTVFVAQLLPFSVGLFVKARYKLIAATLLPPTARLSNYSFVVLIGLLLVTNIENFFLLIGTGTLLSSVVVIGGALLSGYVLGGSSLSTQGVLATTTSTRNAAIALLIATTNFSNPNILIAIVAFSIISVVVGVLAAGEWG